VKIIYSDKHAQHDPQTFFVRGVKQRSSEQPERAERLLTAAKGAGHEIMSPKAHGSTPAETVHTPEYIDFLKTIARDWARLPNASAEVVPNVHPARYPATYPKALAGRAGWHQVDPPARSGRTPGRPPSPPANRRRPPPTWCSTARARPMRSAGRPAIMPMPTWRAASAS
jgi:hypothetical protein